MKRLLLLALVVASCKRGTEPKPTVDEEGSGPERGSAGGFSASLSADLEVRGPSKTGGSGDFFDGSGSAEGSAGSGSAAGAGSAQAGASPAGSAGSAGSAADTGSATGSASAGSTGSASAGSGSGSTGSASAGSATNAGSAATKAEPGVASAGSGAGSGSATKVDPTIDLEPPKPVVAMSPELKAIKLSLLPNWKRDVAGPATISLDVEVQSREVKETFKFSYGYEDPKAPMEREAFKKYLADTKILKVTTDRQRGAAWYLEGNDGSGQFAFRLVVTYGGKRLYCGGSSYKSNSLGDIRDEVVLQAKKICETVTL